MSTTTGATIELRELTKVYGKNSEKAVDNVSLTIKSGELMTFLGPSGSGKTTSLNMIAGFSGVTGGSIYIDGENIVDLPPHHRNIGVVFQQYALFPHMTVGQNIAFPLERRKVSKSQTSSMVADVIERVHLKGLADRYPSELSGGQQQRVAVARAIVFGPKVLLMDEPLGALDKKLREQLQVEISRLHRELGLTIVFVTHDQHEALALSDRIAVFNNGRIEQVGSASDLYETPASLFVADFIGDSTIISGSSAGAGRILTTDGTLLKAGTPAEVGNATACSLVVRPERIRLLRESEPLPVDSSALDAVVTDVVYFGDSRKIYLTLKAGGAAVAKESAGHWSDIGISTQVRLSWPTSEGILVSGTAD